MQEECIRVIKTYLSKRMKLVGELDKYIYSINPYFAQNLKGQQKLQEERFVLETKVKHLIFQTVDLRHKKYQIKDYKWSFKPLDSKTCQVIVYIDQKIEYDAINVTSQQVGQKHQFILTEQNHHWLIEDHQYQDDFKDIFKGHPVVYSEKEYTTRQCLYLNNLKDKISLNQMIQEENLDKNYRLGAYKREKAIEYAKKYALNPCVPRWKNYETMGGDCTNFTSQCLYEGGIPFDEQGILDIEKWYWYSDKKRVPTWTSANAFKNYLITNKRGGVKAQSSNFENMLPGDIIQLGDEGYTRHSMIVVGYIRNREQKIVDLAIAQHSVAEEFRGLNIPLATKPIGRLYWHITN